MRKAFSHSSHMPIMVVFNVIFSTVFRLTEYLGSYLGCWTSHREAHSGLTFLLKRQTPLLLTFSWLSKTSHIAKSNSNKILIWNSPTGQQIHDKKGHSKEAEKNFKPYNNT